MAQRRESVLLELKDSGFSSGMVKNAAATGLLERALKSLDGTTVNIHTSLSESAAGVDNLSRSAKNADGSINQLTGRLRVLGEVAAILAPTLAPIGGLAIAGIGGLANQLGIAAVAGGVLIGSLQGVGDALGAMNKAQLEPTEKNLRKAKDALRALSPAARDFAEEAFALKPALVALRDLGAEELMPGLTESLSNLEDLGPRVAQIMQEFGGVLGDIAADSTAALASERYADFFEFIQAEGPKTLQELATTVGDLTHGLSELWEAFAPLNSDFSSWLMRVADDFDGWASGLSATEGFSEFIDYIRTTGPQVADTLGAIASAAVQIVQATAPLAGPVLAGIESAAKAIGTIADSDLGTPIFAGVTALALLNRTLAVTAALSKTSMSSGIFAGLGTVSTGAKKGAGSLKSLGGDLSTLSKNYLIAGASSERMAAQNKKAIDSIKGTARAIGPTAGLVGGLAVASSGAADSFGLTNTASLALMGTIAGPWGAAIGGGVGLLLDIAAANKAASEESAAYEQSLKTMTSSQLEMALAAEKRKAAEAAEKPPVVVTSKAGTATYQPDDGAAEKVSQLERALADLEWQEKKTALQTKGAALEFLAQTGANVDLAKWSGKSTEQIKAQADAIMATREQADKTARSFVGLADSLNDGKVSLGQWIKDMASTADALNNFTTNSKNAAKRGLDDGLIRSLQAAGEEGALRMRQLANGTDKEIDRANAAFRKGEKAIERYNNYKVPPKKVTADISQAMAGFLGVDRYLATLDGKTATTYVDVVTRTGPKGLAVTGQADGGSVPKDGGPYADRFLYKLAPGEEIISNRFGQADQFRADRAAGRIPGYADGGTTGKSGKRKASGGLFVADRTDALEEAIRRLTEVQEYQTSAVERDIATRDEWASKMASVAQATISGFNTGLFDKDSNPWAAGATGGAIGNLSRDIAGLTERSGLQSQLADMGLSGDALAALLGEGSNQDISGLIASGQVGQYAELYAQRAALQGSVGGAAGQQAYGAQYAAADVAARASLGELQQVNVNLAGLTGRLTAMEKALADAAATAGDSFGASVRGEVVSGHRTKKAGGR